MDGAGRESKTGRGVELNEASPPEAGREREWVASFCEHGDESAFRALYRMHTSRLYRIAVRLLGDEGLAADAVQDVWLRAARGLPGFRWESSLSTWLAGITLNRCREQLRTGRREGEEPLDPEDASPARWSPAERIDLERAIQRLPDGYREAVVLHDIEGYTHEEIAGLLGIEAGTSKSQLFRARRALRELLGRPPQEGEG